MKLFVNQWSCFSSLKIGKTQYFEESPDRSEFYAIDLTCVSIIDIWLLWRYILDGLGIFFLWIVYSIRLPECLESQVLSSKLKSRNGLYKSIRGYILRNSFLARCCCYSSELKHRSHLSYHSSTAPFTNQNEDKPRDLSCF